MALDTYDRVADHYDHAIRPLERWFLARLREKTLRHLPANARLLEVGAGTGLNFGYYPQHTLSVASEPSREMLKLASNKERPKEMWLTNNSAEHLPFKDGSFDAAFATLVFCSVESPAQAFSELRRVVKKGGTIILLEHVRPHGILGFIFDLLNWITVPLFADHVNRKTAAAARASGFEDVKVDAEFLGIINLITCRV
jgi:ubiquinone/menaquinone biosynthesis C-methylase UbiE